MESKQQSIDVIGELIERFDYHIKEYKAGIYNETQTRNDFINPFFEALGWDINNRAGLAESYREVIHEDRLKVGLSTKAPDYCFTVYGQRKFFVEAKKPSVDIKDAIDPAYQLRRYGWSAKMPISIITDFEELSIYDCTVKPTPTDRASVSRIKYLNFKDYLSEIDFLWDTFSKEQVLKGSFDKYISSNKGKKGTTGVDAEFLKSLDSWRDLLARNIVNRNNSIGEDELNYSLQKIIDRIIFLRICEDRGVELEGQLQKSLGSNVYDNLKVLFHSADQKYNSGLFDYKKDTITDSLSIDDKTLKTIIEEMYYPKSPYEFSVIPVEILGHSYEQYLGKVIRITPGHRIKIEEKPEVRKAGGVYYTPQYIVDYIVKNTVGKLVEDKTPEDVSKIKICDPACGSGSFLLGAYQFLLDWHRSYYQNLIISSSTPGLTQGLNIKSKFLTPDGNLTTSIKKQILINNIFGVDIDTNAVEVTKLSLMLKAMEGETEASINNQLSLLHERILPTLDNNIKSGNSLIDIDFYDNQLDFEPNIEKKVKPFNWQSAFPEVFKQSGFDAVIGNPPYGAEISGELEYLDYKYNLTTKRHSNTYGYMMERSFELTKKNGFIGFIVPNTWLTIDACLKLREEILKKHCIDDIISTYQIFPATSGKAPVVDTIIFIIQTSVSIENKNFIYKELNPKLDIEGRLYDLKNSTFISITNMKHNELLQNKGFKIDTLPSFLKKIMQINTINDLNFTVRIGAQEYAVGGGFPVITEEMQKQRIYHSKVQLAEDYYKFIPAGDIKRFNLRWSGTYLKWGKNLHCPREWEIYSLPHLIISRIFDLKSKKLIASFTNELFVNNTDSFCIINKRNEMDLLYILGILNSRLIGFYLSELNINLKRKAYPKINTKDLGNIPIAKINLTNTSEKTLHDKMVEFVDTMLQLNKDLQNVTLPEQKEQIKARIDYTDKKIDRLVYQLYDLTEKEIKIVEGE